MLCLKKHSRKNPTDNYITNPGGDCYAVPAFSSFFHIN